MNLNSWVMKISIIIALAMPASALSGSLEYSALGSNIKIDTTYTLGDAIYTNSLTAPATIGDELSYIHGTDSIGPEYSSKLDYNLIMNNRDLSWTTTQSMKNSDEQAMIETTMSGTDAVASYSASASLSDLSFNSLLKAMTPVDEDILSGADISIADMLSDGQISIDQTYSGMDVNNSPSEISQKVLASEQAKINLIGSFNLTSGVL
jgi:hypothetical protein